MTAVKLPKLPTRHRPYWKAWLAFVSCLAGDLAAVATGDVTAMVLAGCTTVTAVGAVLFGPANAPATPKG